MLPTISIVTPSFNQASFLSDTIKSVLSQGYPDLEYIVIDGGSTDGSRQIIRNFSNQVNYWVSERDLGQSHAINKGFIRANGNIVGWINSDDILADGCLKTVGNHFADNPDIDIVYGGVENFDSVQTRTIFNITEFDPIEFLTRNSLHQPGIFFRRSILKKTGLLDQSMHYCMDYDLWVRIFLQFKSQRIEKTLAQFRVHSESKTVDNPAGMYFEWRTVLCKLISSLGQRPIQKLKKLSIYYEGKPRSWNLKPIYDLDVDAITKNYIFQCALQEYGFGNIKNANKLFFNSLGSVSWLRSTAYILSNSMGLKKVGIL